MRKSIYTLNLVLLAAMLALIGPAAMAQTAPPNAVAAPAVKTVEIV
ncbi:MAG: hypothetical protein QOD00_739, partial [Blastocatellia bacterium]|nr:hypothetical protein [Blastocatellia bacterium]